MTLYAALLLGYTIHFIYCIWGNLRITVAELIAAMPRHCAMLLATGYRQCRPWLVAQTCARAWHCRRGLRRRLAR